MVKKAYGDPNRQNTKESQLLTPNPDPSLHLIATKLKNNNKYTKLHGEQLFPSSGHLLVNRWKTTFFKKGLTNGSGCVSPYVESASTFLPQLETVFFAEPLCPTPPQPTFYLECKNEWQKLHFCQNDRANVKAALNTHCYSS